MPETKETTEEKIEESKPLNIYQRLQLARKLIGSTELKKAGWNDYSKYAYFTPEQVEKLVSDANEEVGIIVLVNLKADEYGYYQELTLINESDLEDRLSFHLRTECGSLKATNQTQNMGAMDTYSERYLKQKAYLIKDNTLDPDSQDNRPGAQKVTARPGMTPSGAPTAATKRTEMYQKHADEGENVILMDEDEMLV
jgi:hypothetical protein